MRIKFTFNLLVLAAVVFSFLPILATQCIGSSKSSKLKEIEDQSKDIRRKIEETRKKEQLAVTKLTKIQRELYQAQSELKKNKFKLSSTKNDLTLTENKLFELKEDYSKLREDAQTRIKQIYQGQRLRVLEMLLRTPNLTDLLDILYYQKRLVSQDKELLEKLTRQSIEIERFKEKLAQKKISIANIVGSIEKQKSVIAREHSNQSKLVDKLRTERTAYEQAERQLERESQALIFEINKLT